jgi:hypothetical protein
VTTGCFMIDVMSAELVSRLLGRAHPTLRLAVARTRNPLNQRRFYQESQTRLRVVTRESCRQNPRQITDSHGYARAPARNRSERPTA